MGVRARIGHRSGSRTERELPEVDAVVEAGLLVAAGVLAGLVGTAGGITSLVSYPALLAVGVPALAANVANIVAGVACWPGAALASRPELAGRGPWLRRWTPVAAAGGVTGAALLLSTSPGVFARVVPFLVAAGSFTLLAQPRLSARLRQRGARTGGPALPVGLVAVSLYNGYFGAGAGVITLALVLVTVDGDLPRANALKNMLIGAGAVVSATALVWFGPVDWAVVVPLAVGMFSGAVLGPRVTRRLPPAVLRWAVALLGLGLAVELLVRPAA
ncbi:sulfite exporter TauE/SafE family protein [Streptomyces sp. Z26]|uniref:sulfite exporter TauE/SafE family protein n=1 Tax=Streptomyces TaxID=1883 RepID=UPI0019D2AFA0|nr:sulfite exporter TauE/SafE family protein [Streptomyces sp. Z26]